MNIGIIGSGGCGSNAARALAPKGISATISTRCGPASLAPLVAELGPSIKAGTGDNADAKAQVRKMLDGMGYFAVDLGSLAMGGRLAELPFVSLASTNFIKI